MWKTLFESYQVSDTGKIRRKLATGKYKVLKCSVNNRGYRYFQLQRNGKRINYFVHVSVAKVFIGARPGGKVVDHRDRNKLNNKVGNLRYVSQRVNSNN